MKPTLTFTLDHGPEVDYELVDGPIADTVIAMIETGQTSVHHSWNEQGMALRDLTVELDHMARVLGLETRDLNHLHRCFETQHKSAQQNPDWERLNRLIHSIESHQHARVLGLHLVTEPSYEPVIITDDLRPYWSHMPRLGDCCLGYATIGKDLVQAMTTDDHQLVRDQQLTPQTQMRLEFLLFYRDPARVISNRTMHRQIYQWTRARRVDHLVDWDLPENRCHGRPLAARIKHTAQLEQIARARQVTAVRLDQSRISCSGPA